METVGEILKNQRIQKALSIKDISERTNISSKYLTAIEDNNFSFITGDTYVQGFIRNYAKTLGLNPDEMVQLYKEQIRFEKNPPIDILTQKMEKDINWLPFIVIGGIILLGLVGYLTYPYILQFFNSTQSSDQMEEFIVGSSYHTEEETLILEEGSPDYAFSVKETTLLFGVDEVNPENVDIHILLESNQSVVFDNRIEYDKMLKLDVDSDEIFDVQIRLTPLENHPKTVQITIASTPLDDLEVVDGPQTNGEVAEEAPPTTYIKLEIIPKGPAVISYSIDDGNRISKQITAGDDPLIIMGDNRVQLMASDVQNFHLRFNETLIHPKEEGDLGYTYYLGNPGGITNCIFYYNHTSDKYEIEVLDKDLIITLE